MNHRTGVPFFSSIFPVLIFYGSAHLFNFSLYSYTAGVGLIFILWFWSNYCLVKYSTTMREGKKTEVDDDFVDIETIRKTIDDLDEKKGEYTAYRLWRKFVEKDEYLRSWVSIAYFAAELLELGAIEIVKRDEAKYLRYIGPEKYKIKSEKMIGEHVKKYFERPFGWQKFMALKRRFSRRKSA